MFHHCETPGKKFPSTPSSSKPHRCRAAWPRWTPSPSHTHVGVGLRQTSRHGMCCETCLLKVVKQLRVNQDNYLIRLFQSPHNPSIYCTTTLKTKLSCPVLKLSFLLCGAMKFETSFQDLPYTQSMLKMTIFFPHRLIPTWKQKSYITYFT